MESRASDAKLSARLDQPEVDGERETKMARQVADLIEIAATLDDLDLTGIPLRSGFDPGWPGVER